MKLIDIDLDKFAEEFITEMFKKTRNIPNRKALLTLLGKRYKFNSRDSKEITDRLITIKNAVGYLQKRLLSKKGRIKPSSIKMEGLKDFPYSQNDLEVAINIVTNLRESQKGNIFVLPLIKEPKNKKREKSK